MKRVNCFEIGNIFTPQEQTVLGILLTGQKNYDPLIERINKVLGVKLSFEAVGKSRLELLDVKQPNPITTQIPIDQVPDIKPTHKPINLPQFKPISKYPPLVRDVTLVEQELDVSAIRDLFPELLFVEEIDSYLNPTTKKKSVTYRFLFQKFENSFVSEEIKSIDQRIERYLNDQR
jgi:phenylalanyl-tRNA synthetase beta subunit